MNAKERTILTQCELHAEVSHNLAKEAGQTLSKMAKSLCGHDSGNNVKNFTNLMAKDLHALERGVAIHNFITVIDCQAKGDAAMDIIRRLRK